MCGIVGLIGRTPLTADDHRMLDRLNEQQHHRGPDGAGRFIAEQFAMAMRRLSIIDLNSGWQPLYNEDKSIALVANGEVYNYVELRKDLQVRGHTFRTGSDCETICHLYEEYGDGVVQHLRGMYAFALYDAKQQRVLLCRDRMGEKPLYLVETSDRIYFASEMKALLGAKTTRFELDRGAIWEYLHYAWVPEPRTAVKGIRKLPAGHTLSIDLKQWKVDQRCYWRLEDAPPIDGDPSKVVRSELERIAELIIRSDVPVGVALSRGVDSSAIAALAQRNYPGTIQAITVGYEGMPRQDERLGAREFVQQLRIPHHEVELRVEDVVEGFADMCFMRDDPISDIAGSGYLAVMRAARERGVLVMLMGHGGDELFWGYQWHRAAFRRTLLKQRMRAGGQFVLPHYLRPSMPPRSITWGLRWLRNGGGVLSGLRNYRQDRNSPSDRFVFYDDSPFFHDAEEFIPRYVVRGFRDEMRNVDLTEPFAVPEPWQNIDVQQVRMICQSYLLENGLAQGDRLSMAASVELRAPLVDYKLAETVVGLMKTHPTDENVRPKAWLWNAVRDFVPQFVFDRPKTGFNAPARLWLEGVHRKYGPLLRDGYLQSQGIVAPGVVLPNTELRLTTLELWCRKMLAHAA
ncbi:MAG: asparagine synthase (glutamine-hydrolyzing) [Tepidisphaeraceae bacterium]